MGGSTSQPLLTLEAEGTVVESKFRIPTESNSRIEDEQVKDLISRVNQAIDDAQNSKQYRRCRLRTGLTTKCKTWFYVCYMLLVPLFFIGLIGIGIPFILKEYESETGIEINEGIVIAFVFVAIALSSIFMRLLTIAHQGKSGKNPNQR